MRRALRGSRLRGNDGSFRLPLPPITLILIPSNTLILIPSNTLILIPSNTLILIPSNTLILIPSNTLILIPSNTLILILLEHPQGRRDPHPPSEPPFTSSSPLPSREKGPDRTSSPLCQPPFTLLLLLLPFSPQGRRDLGFSSLWPSRPR